ncbi:MAG TPA: glycosyltransferase family 2 protein [Draconibacterium sp.]|nr:glycosyltransferase family 2 protein [Draconibacterium sp.]
MFADKYLIKNQNTTLIFSEPDPETGIIVIIPCLREPDILQTLESLENCLTPVSKVEVIVVVNHSEAADKFTKEFNQNSVQEIEGWISENDIADIRFYVVGPVELRKKWAGAGLARKQGMDEAVRRFNSIAKKDGIIVSLDADTLVEPNYLLEIESHFKTYIKNVGATIRFEHQKENLDAKQFEGIELYELYLGYYKKALEFTGYPYSLFTVGSAFAVKAEAYVKRGGMNRRQAGEDFYFLQNLVQLGPVGQITTTCVHPSARLSNRVPFGTGPILAKWMSGEEDLQLTYDLQSFIELKAFFDRRSSFYRKTNSEYNLIIDNLPESVRSFLLMDNFWNELDDLNQNCATVRAFENRFFQKFNAFKILKYLNFTTEHFYPKNELVKQAEKLHQMFSV